MKRKSDGVCTVGEQVHPLYSRSVRYLIILLSLSTIAEASDRQPVYWRFPGPLGGELRETLMLQGIRVTTTICVNDEVTAYLATRGFPRILAVLTIQSDANPWRKVSSKHRVLALGSLRRRRAVQVSIESSSTCSSLAVLRQTFTGTGKTMEVAARKAFSAMRGQGTLALTLEPNDASLIDGQPFGQGSGEYIVGAGQRVIAVQAPGHTAVQESIRMDVGDRVSLTIRLPIADGRIRLSTQPVKTRVFLNDKLWATPAAERSIKPGTYRLKVEAKGYFTLEKSVTKSRYWS